MRASSDRSTSVRRGFVKPLEPRASLLTHGACLFLQGLLEVKCSLPFPEMQQVRLDVHEGRFILRGGTAAGRDNVHRIVVGWPGWRRRVARKAVNYSVYSGPVNASTAKEVLGCVSLNIAPSPEALTAARSSLRELELSQAILAGDIAYKVAPTSLREPMPHQAKAIGAIDKLGFRALLADDMGLGKTATSLWAVAASGAKRLLVICPVSVKWNWEREIKLTLGDKWKTIVIDGTVTKRAQIFVDINHPKGDFNRALIINYDLLRTLSPFHMAILREHALDQAVICDESHYLKNHAAKRTKAVNLNFMPSEKGSRVRLLLSGTPVRNTIEDLYSQLTLVSPGIWATHTEFVQNHLVLRMIEVNRRRVMKTVGTRNVAQLNAIVNTVQIRRLKGEVLDLPPKIHTQPELTLCSHTKSIYKAMKDYALIKLSELSDSASVFEPQARSAVEIALRCEQIAQGFCGGIPEPVMDKMAKHILKNTEQIPGRPREIIFPTAPKLLWLLDTIQGLTSRGYPVFVVSKYNAPLFWLQRQVEKSVILHGGLTAKGKDDVVAQFQSGEANVIFGQVRMCEGFELTRSTDVLFYGRDWSPAVNFQAEDRCHRIGTKGTVNVQIPIVRGTIEVPINTRLQQKALEAAQAIQPMSIHELKEAL